MRRAGQVNLVTALLLAGLAGAGTAYAVDVRQDAQQAEWDAWLAPVPDPPGGRLQAAIDEIRADGVHVADDARWMVSERAERELERAAATSDHQVLTIVWTGSNHAGDGYENVGEKLEQEFAGEQAVIYVYEGPSDGDVVVVGAYPYQFEYDSFTSFLGDPETMLLRAVLDAEQRPAWELDDPPTDEDYWGGPVGRIAAGVLLALLAIPVLLGFLCLLHLVAGRGFRLPGRWLWS